MKRHFFLKLIAALCLFLLAGCGAPAEEKAQAEPETKGEETPVVQELTAVELQPYFEKAYEAKGNCLDTPEQLALELTELEVLTVDAALPVDYKAQYQTWRSEKVTNVLEEIQASYHEILADLPQYSYLIPGACYADYVDFEGDGYPELLVISFEKIPNYTGIDNCLQAVLTVYASKQGETEKIGEGHSYSWAYDSVGLCKGEQETFVHIRHYAGRGGDCADEYYGVKDGCFLLLDHVSCFDSTWEGKSDNYVYTSFEEDISAEKYQTIVQKYFETEDIVSLDHSTPIVDNRGILPEPSPDLFRRAAMLESLDHTDGLIYAKLIDENTLVVLHKDGSSDYQHYFCIYSWDGAEIQTIELNKVSDPDITYYLETGFTGYEICKEKTTGTIYYKYGGEIAGGWCGALFINADDYQFCGEPSFPSDGDTSDWSESDWNEFEAEEKKYEENNNRFETIEKIIPDLNDYANVLDEVRQQLIEG